MGCHRADTAIETGQKSQLMPRQSDKRTCRSHASNVRLYRRSRCSSSSSSGITDGVWASGGRSTRRGRRTCPWRVCHQCHGRRRTCTSCVNCICENTVNMPHYGKVTVVPVRRNGNFQTPISVPAVRPKRCHTLLNPVHRQDYTVACLNYTLQTMMPLSG